MDALVAIQSDPDELSVEEVMARVAEELTPEPSAIEKLTMLANHAGNIAESLQEAAPSFLARIGVEVVEDYEQDKRDRQEWEDTAVAALESAKQKKKSDSKDFPWKGASNIRFPLLTPAALQFWARMLPAVIKGDEAILCKVVGRDAGRPQMGPDGKPLGKLPTGEIVPATAAAQLPPEVQQQIAPVWLKEPGAKTKRAQRVSEYLNTVLFYRMDDWESDTSNLLMQLPIVGCVFRKIWYDAQTGKQRMAMVSALRIFLPKGARSETTTPRLTEEMPDIFPHEISAGVRSGYYRDAGVLTVNEAGEVSRDEALRLLLEQQRLIDLDGDGLPEPYIVTVDHGSAKVLRIEANYGPDDIKLNGAGEVVSITRGRFYVKHGLFPDPEGGYYDLGLGHLLEQIGDLVDTAFNQLIDAGTAQTAGGGFIGSGVRLQGKGANSTIYSQPGVYRNVDVSGNAVREAIVEMTKPVVSPVTFQVLDLILGVARDISGAKDVITGEASNNGQVGTTLALIEQGLQVFNATAKCEFRSLKDEFTLLKDNIVKYGGEAARREYDEILDDPEADFDADLNAQDMDIRPVSDPSSVTRMQKMAKAQFLASRQEAIAGMGGDVREIERRILEAADVEDIDKILPPQQPQQPNPMQVAEVEAKQAQTQKDNSTAALNMAKAGDLQATSILDNERLKLDALRSGVQSGMAMMGNGARQ